MMEQFKEKYKSEAKGTVEQIKEILPKLRQNQDDTAMRYDIFRHMHSLKGGGAMFGFLELSEITALFEHAYDKYRENLDTIPESLFKLTEVGTPLFLALLETETINLAENVHLKNDLSSKLKEMI